MSSRDSGNSITTGRAEIGSDGDHGAFEMTVALPMRGVRAAGARQAV
jgi:hypothetical protein